MAVEGPFRGSGDADRFVRNWLAKDGHPLTFGSPSDSELLEQIKSLDNLQNLLGQSTKGDELAVVYAGEHARPNDVYARAGYFRTILLNRLLKQRSTEQIAAIQDAVDTKVDDPEVKRELSEVVSTLADEQRELENLLEDRSDGGHSGSLEKIRVQELKWKMRWSLLQREPVAVLVGAVLLVGFSIVVAAAMWTHTEVPDVITSMLLLILGFFFGQNASGKGNSGE